MGLPLNFRWTAVELPLNTSWRSPNFFFGATQTSQFLGNANQTMVFFPPNDGICSTRAQQRGPKSQIQGYVAHKISAATNTAETVALQSCHRPTEDDPK